MTNKHPKDIPLEDDLGKILDKEEAKDRPARTRLRALIRRRPGIAAAARTLRDLSPKQRLSRVQSTFIFAFQCALAAGVAFYVAVEVIGHVQPFFAPMAGVITLGVNGGKRMRRGFELVLGATLGVGIGDFVIQQIGSGYWQVSVVVLAGILTATFIDRGPMVAIQAANTGVLIATILPPGSGGSTDRMVDALIGGIIGLLVMAIVPRSPLRAARRELSSLISKAALVLDEVAAALELKDGDAIGEALETARGTQSIVEALLSEAKGGSEIVAISPLYWSARRHANSMLRTLEPVDNMVRSIRVLARRAEILVEDGEPVSPELVELVRDLSDALGHLGSVYADGGTRGTRREAVEVPEIVRALQKLASEATPDMIPNHGLSGTTVVAQVRSTIVDALIVCGYSRESAMASLVPTVKEPWHPPEVWGDDPLDLNEGDKPEG